MSGENRFVHSGTGKPMKISSAKEQAEAYYRRAKALECAAALFQVEAPTSSLFAAEQVIRAAQQFESYLSGEYDRAAPSPDEMGG